MPHRYIALLMVCLSCTCIKCIQSDNSLQAVTSAPITRIICNYEKHLMKLKEKYENLHTTKRARLKERNVNSAVEVHDDINMIDESTQENDDDSQASSISMVPIILSPLQLSNQEIGLLPGPSTIAPRFPHRRLLKYLTEYSKRRFASTNRHQPESKEALVSDDTVADTEDAKELDRSGYDDDNDSRTKQIDTESNNSNTTSANARFEEWALSKKVAGNKTRRHEANNQKRRQRLSQLNKKKAKKHQTYSIVNLLTASVLSDRHNPTRTIKPTNVDEEPSPVKEKPIWNNLPIRRLEDAKPVDQQENESNSDKDDLPFLMRSDLFTYLSTSTQSSYVLDTTKQPNPHLTMIAKTLPTIALPPSTTAALWQSADMAISDLSFITEPPTTAAAFTKKVLNIKDSGMSHAPRARQRHLASIAAFKSPRYKNMLFGSAEVNELEPTDLETQIDFSRIHRLEPKRQHSLEDLYLPDELDHVQYIDDNDDFPFYTRKKYHNQQQRFGFQQKPIRRPYYSDNDDEMDFYLRRNYLRKSMRFPLRIQSAHAIPLPKMVVSSEDQAVQEIEHETVNPTLTSSQYYFTPKNDISGKLSNSASTEVSQPLIKQQAPSPEEQQNAAPPVPTSLPSQQQQLLRPDLQMSADNCHKVQSYSVLFGVPDPQAWVRKNCAFVQTFVHAPCDEINAFVDSCYRFLFYLK